MRDPCSALAGRLGGGRGTARIRPGDIIALMVVRDEALRLPSALQHLWKLGVDRLLLVDNRSTDGTREIAGRDERVHLVDAPGSYCGVALRDHLDQRAPRPLRAGPLGAGGGRGRVSRLPRQRPARRLARAVPPPRRDRIRGAAHLPPRLLPRRAPAGPALPERRGPDRRRAVVRTADPAPGDERTLPLPAGNSAGCANGSSSRKPSPTGRRGGSTRSSTTCSGACRRCARPSASGRSRRSGRPTSPRRRLLRWREGAGLIRSTHMLRPMALAAEQPSGVLLHFKFLQDFHARAEDAVARDAHFDGSREYRRYLEALERDPAFSLHTGAKRPLRRAGPARRTRADARHAAMGGGPRSGRDSAVRGRRLEQGAETGAGRRGPRPKPMARTAPPPTLATRNWSFRSTISGSPFLAG